MTVRYADVEPGTEIPGKSYRAIYLIRDETLLVLVVKVGDRKDVYRRVK